MTTQARLSREDLQQIQDVADAATKGPWRAFVEGRDHESGSSFIRTAGEDIELSGATEHDYVFIACAREIVPRLLDEVRALRAELERARDG